MPWVCSLCLVLGVLSTIFSLNSPIHGGVGSTYLLCSIFKLQRVLSNKMKDNVIHLLSDPSMSSKAIGLMQSKPFFLSYGGKEISVFFGAFKLW